MRKFIKKFIACCISEISPLAVSRLGRNDGDLLVGDASATFHFAQHDDKRYFILSVARRLYRHPECSAAEPRDLSMTLNCIVIPSGAQRNRGISSDNFC